MAEFSQNQYHPDFIPTPGRSLLGTLEYIGMSHAELAQRMGYPVRVINEIILGKGAITPEVADQLAEILDGDASFWLRREERYRAYLARLAINPHLVRWVRWLNTFPIPAMIELGWLPCCESPTQQVFELLRFFDESSTAGWQVTWTLLFKKYLSSPVLQRDFAALTAWVRQGEVKAQEVFTRPYDAQAFRKVLGRIRAFIGETVGCLREALVRLCAEVGVVVVFVEELPKVNIRAATKWLHSTKKALILLSPRYETNEQLLLTFFHAAGHLLLHDNNHQVFLEIEQEERDETEEQADRFAANLLIDTVQWQQFVEPGAYRTEKGVTEFAQKMGIAPGIVLRRLQEEKLLPLDHFNHLKAHLQWPSSPQRHVSLG